MLYAMNVRQQPFGGFVGEFPDFPGCCPEGDTLDELMDNARDAVMLWIENNGSDTMPPPSLPELQDNACPPLFVELDLPAGPQATRN